MKKFRGLMAIVAAFSLTTTGCATINAEGVEAETKAVSEQQTADRVDIKAVQTVYADEDTDSQWSKEESTAIALTGSTASVSGDGAAVDGSVVTISAAGTYVLSGTLTDGQIMIDAGKNDLVRIVLNSASISNSSGTAIYAKKADKTVLILADGTENTVSDGEAYADTSDEAPDSAIFVKNDMSITGKGTLTVTGNYNNGISVKDNLTITDGVINVTAKNDGIRGKDSLVVSDGQFNITAGNDGMKANNDSDTEKGYIVLDGGVYIIASNNDAIQAETSLTVNGGMYNIKTGGGADNAVVQQDSTPATGQGGAAARAFRQGGFTNSDGTVPTMPDGTSGGNMTLPDDAARPGGRGNGTMTMPDGMTSDAMVQGDMPDGTMTPPDVMTDGNMTPPSDMPDGTITPPDGITDSSMTATQATGGTSAAATEEQTTADETSDSYKGLKATAAITINGGEFIIDTEDDGIHSNGDVTINDGTFSIKTGDDGIHADVALLVSGGNISIEKCYEGLEGKTVDITGGEISIAASDDGINAAGGSTNSGMRFGSAASYEYYIKISGGVIEVTAGYDALDANGNIFIEGGTIYANGASQGMDGAIDCDGELVITGGTLIGVGSVMTPSTKSTQATLIVSHKSAQSSGSVITLKDSSGEDVIQYTTQKSYSASAITASSLEDGKTYQLYSGETKLCDVTLNGIVTTIADDGSAASSNLGGGMGGRQGQGGIRN